MHHKPKQQRLAAGRVIPTLRLPGGALAFIFPGNTVRLPGGFLTLRSCWEANSQSHCQATVPCSWQAHSQCATGPRRRVPAHVRAHAMGEAASRCFSHRRAAGHTIRAPNQVDPPNQPSDRAVMRRACVAA
eukprot:366350-Chlamydomonas_euryale.AAC.4